MRDFNDPATLTTTGESPVACFARALPLESTEGAAYVERRGISVALASAAGVRFLPDCNGRPAVVVLLRDRNDEPTALHARYLQTARDQNKMCTFGVGGGVISLLAGWRADPLILVEGLFDALSVAVCGWSSVATIGRWSPWLLQVAAQRVVWLGFDGNRPGDVMATHVAALLSNSQVRRLRPPPRCKDWNTALVKRGPHAISRWMRESLSSQGGARQ
jgi:DNA primase